ncbi:MAG TPA: PrsW family intramembrane metalloprotease [Candidatus Nitrosotenuis sp.]|nr:PrsW family intramembrane metalloprotease [Candidatus Nitrosotenuis sp.]
MEARAFWRIFTWVVVGLGIALCGVLTLGEWALMAAAYGPAVALVALLIAGVPAVFFLVAVLALDLYEPEPPALLLLVLLWGAGVATLTGGLASALAGGLTQAVLAAFAPDRAATVAQIASVCLFAPLFEEAAKAVVLLGLFFFKRDEFNGIIDGIIYGALAGLGFAITENVGYHGGFVQEGGWAGGLAQAAFRQALLAFMHPLWTSITGLGLGWARQSRSWAVRILAPPLGFAGAVGLHGAWNSTAVVTGMVGNQTLFLLMPALYTFVILLVLGVAAYNLHREATLLKRHLWPEVEAGRLTPEEHRLLCSFWARLRASMSALGRRGLAGWWACVEFSHTATELAILRQRVHIGELSSAQGAELEKEHLARLAALRGRF